MCGITGVLNLNGCPLEDRGLVKRMASNLMHRGPDDEGLVLDGPVGLGFRRLSIIDLEAGHQPIPNEDETVWVMFNGEIYNFVELREDLVKRGHRFRTQSDTEVIVHAYETYGLDFVRYLRGMFAIALWDKRMKRLTLVRDRIGKKPLFWSLHNQQLAFASEVKALMPWPGLDRTLDPAAIDDYLSFLYVPAPRTIFRNVRKLPPAHVLVASCDTGNVETFCYWKLQSEPDRSKTRAYFVEELRALLEESVRIRLRSDVPLGAFLSGGIDSTAVVGIMSRGALAEQVKTFSMGFEDTHFDETHYARIAAKSFGTNHTEEVVGPIDIDTLQRLVWFLDEPFADSSAIPTYQVSRLARQHVTVALSGDGGDELFAGYPRYQHIRLLRRLAGFPGAIRHGLSSLSYWGHHLLAPYWKMGGETLRRLNKALDICRLTEPQQMLALLSYFEEGDKSRLYSREFAEQLQHHSSLTDILEWVSASPPDQDPIVSFMARDLGTNLVDDALVKVDRMSMACSLEVRCPLLDHKVVEFAATIPPELKLQGSKTKLVFKEAVADILPSAIVNRGKWGFEVPFGSWFKGGDWQLLLNDCLSRESVRRRGLFDPAYVDGLRRAITDERMQMQKLKISSHQLWHRVWTLLMFELWARQYVDSTL